MAWTEYTDYLGATGIVARAKMNELWDAFSERLLATGGSAAIDGIYLTALKDQRFPVRTITYTNRAGTVATKRLDEALNEISLLYAKADNSKTPWGVSELLHQAGTDLGYTSAQVDALVSERVKTFAYMDVCRRAIQLLRYPGLVNLLTFNEEVGRSIDSNESDGWAAAKTLYYSATEAPHAGNDFGPFMRASLWSGTGQQYNITGVRLLGTVSIPATTPFSSYDLWAFNESSKEPFVPAGWTEVFVPELAVMNVGIAMGSLWITAEGEFKIVVGTGLSETGDLASDFKARSYDDNTGIDNYEPAPEEWRSIRFKVFPPEMTNIVAAPTFTHPYEVI